jgi:ribosomal protein L12E/L44/L45/RPP1/RPP2
VIVVEEYEADKFIVALEEHNVVGLLDRTKNQIEAIPIPSGENTVMSLKSIKTDDG